MIAECILFVLITFSAYWRRNKFVYAMMLIMMIALMAFTTFNLDFENYQLRYQLAEKESRLFSSDLGFTTLMFLCRRCGLSFSSFLLIVSVVGLFLLSYCLWKYYKFPCISLAFFFIVFYYLYSVQLRSFISEMIIVFAVLYILEKNSKPLVYCVMITIATLFHYTAIFYFVMLVPILLKKKNTVYLTAGSLPFMLPVLYEAVYFIGGRDERVRMEIYFDSSYGSVTIGTIVFIALFLLLIIITSQKSKHMMRMGLSEKALRYNMINNFVAMNFMTIVLMVLFSNNFFRLLRPMILITMLYLVDDYFSNNRSIVNAFQRYQYGIALVPSLFIMYELTTQTWYNAIQLNSLMNFLGIS